MKEKKRISKRLTTKQKVFKEKKHRAQAREQRRQERKSQRREDKMPYALIKTDDELEELKEIRRNAEKRQKEYEERSKAPRKEEKKEKEDSSRQYLKYIHKLLKESDVIIQVLDARDPQGSRCPEIEKAVREKEKKLIFLLNKIDLVPKSNWMEWMLHLKNICPTLPFKASLQQQRSHLGQTEKTEHNACAYGVKDLISLLKNYTRGGVSITVGVIGCPNVGKSSIINSLKRERACEVKNTPGVTRHLQTLILDKELRLIDSPGVIYKEGNRISNALRASVTEIDAEEILSLVFEKVSREKISMLYGIEEPSSPENLLVLLAIKWGKLAKGGVPDTRTVSFMLLRDLQIGRIRFYTNIPKETQIQESQDFLLDIPISSLPEASPSPQSIPMP
ncbi:nuclear GTP-binding protein [Nematocida sp. LUAm3]|nr:nuclear GTP-binding protein [Nematocida sp. LUAm3]KAI5175973.1 nuclear GTP-binding protein [Nematocida sp. LUAm2]KAI5179069.1 nuclear GTP-binding protein [Nematocida sp. LUAm1]